MEVMENQKEHLSDFIRLNEEWISTYFELEEVDFRLAANPYEIIENGGYIFSLTSESEVIGVCALFNEGSGKFELARMAVSPKYQSKGCGQMLIESCFEKLSEIGAKTVYLVSNTKLEAAISLYQKNGFKVVSQGRHPIYSRANIVTERDVS